MRLYSRETHTTIFMFYCTLNFMVLLALFGVGVLVQQQSLSYGEMVHVRWVAALCRWLLFVGGYSL